ncbi:MAG: c-type cytochrome [Blastocatellia bacterium]|nr:c-type cytochrome [Blastocatellia bacterium]
MNRMKTRRYLAVFIGMFGILYGLISCSSKPATKPPYTPAEALGTFQLPEEFRIELVASEPAVTDPVALAWDESGRLFVVEMPDYPLNPEPMGKVILLEDRDGDGKYETSKVFAEGLHMPTGVMPWKKGILVTAAPDILYFEDTDGDGKADVRKVILTGFAVTNPQLRVNGLQYSLDNWIYAAYPRVPVPRRYVKEFGDPGHAIQFAGHPEVPAVDIRARDLRFDPDRLKVEAVSGNSQFGNAFDDWGNRFTVWNNDHIRHVVLPPEVLARNPHLSIPQAMQSASDHENAATVYPITKNAFIIHDSQVGHFTSACGLSVYTGGNFPEDYQHSSFTCEPVHNLVHCDRLTLSGASFEASRALEGKEFLSSTDAWFRPVYTAIGPDGALYIADYYRFTVEHPEFVPPELLKQIDFEPRHKLGRIYRVVYKDAKKIAKPDLANATSDQLVELLSHENRWWRINAQRLLVDRQAVSERPALERLAANGSSPLGRIHALWTLHGLGVLSDEVVLRALQDESPPVRENGLVMAAERIPEKAIALLTDSDGGVRFRAAVAVSALPPERSAPLLQKLVLAHPDDMWLLWVALSTADSKAIDWYARLVGRSALTAEESKNGQAFVQKLSAVIGARDQDEELARVLAVVRSSRGGKTSWWRAATLDGLADGRRTGAARAGNLPKTQALLPQMLLNDELAVNAAALRLARTFRWKDEGPLAAAVGAAGKLARDKAGSAAARAVAVGVMGLDSSEAQSSRIGEFLKPQEPEAVQVAASQTLAIRDDNISMNALLENWRGFTNPVREASLATFFQKKERLPVLLKAVKDGKVQAWSFGPARTRQLLESADSSIKQQAQEVLGNLEGERKKVYERYLPALTMAGDPDRGKDVFVKNCTDCHKLDGQGHEVGPDLLSVTTHYKEVLLADILIPNQAIETGYEEYLVELKDGRSITGIVSKDTTASLTLRRAKGEEDVVLRSNITSIRSLNVSPMPADLEQNISIQQMADLIAYIKNRK